MKLEGDAKFLFYAMMQAAIKMQSLGKSRKDYLEFAKGIWETLELNDGDKLKKIMFDDMMSDIKEL